MDHGLLPLLLFGVTLLVLLLGFPVAFTLMGVSVFFALLGDTLGVFSFSLLASLPGRIFAIMMEEIYAAVPLFIFMGVVLERSRLAEDLLLTMGQLFGTWRGGLGISVVVVGALLAASTGIVGATVVTMGLISLPAMQKARYDDRLSSGIICASGTLAQLIPPSTVLILLGVMLQNANIQANLKLGKFDGAAVTSTDLFAAALLPGLAMVGLFLLFLVVKALRNPATCPAVPMTAEEQAGLIGRIALSVVPPLLLILIVLGSILGGFATATESAGMGAMGAFLLALTKRRVGLTFLRDVSRSTLLISGMIFVVLVGATCFSLVFRGLGGEEAVTALTADMPGGAIGATLFVLALMFALGFLLDTFEIIFIVVPIFAPILFLQGIDPIWLGIAMAIILQTSYLTPPFGFAIFYLQGVAPGLRVTTIYRGVVPFVFLQLAAVVLLWEIPSLATWLPTVLFR